MKKINIRIPLIVLFFLLEIMSLFLTIKSYINKEIKIAEEIYVTEKNMFSMFVETDNGYEEYLESNKFPEGYKINLEESKCLDLKGNVIEGILSGSGTNITVTSKTTSYCYLYFDIPPITVETLPNIAGSDLWDSTLEGDGYRYVGTDPNNYVCFGYDNTEEDCDFTNAANTDLYAYRIIGIFEDNEGTPHIKLIKKEALNTAYAWNEDFFNEIIWENSELYNGLNGEYFLNNKTYLYMQDDFWQSMIFDWNYIAVKTLKTENCTRWLNGACFYKDQVGIGYEKTAVSSVYLHEMHNNNLSDLECHSYGSYGLRNCDSGIWNNVTSKIGLMYVSDYLLSLGQNSLNYKSDDNYTTLKIGWMHISNNDITLSNYDERTIADAGKDPDYGTYFTWVISADGSIYSNSTAMLNVVHSVRPVFYLTSDVELSGEGTIGSPYIIS